MTISPLTKKQVNKVVKALLYSFGAGFTATLGLQAVNFITAAQSGSGAVVDLFVALIAGATVGGINAVAVALVQFTKE